MGAGGNQTSRLAASSSLTAFHCATGSLMGSACPR
ncbi:Uncharacterised protein [Mycobacteroides abscessus subsp. abscessus]|nr:Uncharacterised protein [Mycobacteroides abscessus subsp. abscessus]SKU86309.1 Uncharacterised protein [Mycobacteroides abscessus subsp. abscessus]